MRRARAGASRPGAGQDDAARRIDDAVGVDAIQFASGNPKAGLTPRWCSKRPPTATVECAGGLRCCGA